MNMRLALALIFLFVSGCAMGKRIVDVSNDPRFQGGYRVGQTYRLRASGFLVKAATADGWELWTAAEEAAEPSPTAIAVPAGATVRIERLGYLYDDYHPPVTGGQLEMLFAYGRLTFASGAEFPNDVLVLPKLRDAETVPGTSVQVFPVDGEFLERLRSSSTTGD
jgi:hypothetical protein